MKQRPIATTEHVLRFAQRKALFGTFPHRRLVSNFSLTENLPVQFFDEEGNLNVNVRKFWRSASNQRIFLSKLADDLGIIEVRLAARVPCVSSA